MEQPEWGKKLSKCCIIPQRVILAILGTFSIVVCYGMRLCLSLAIIVMVVKREKPEKDTSNSICPVDPNTKPNEHAGGDYDWSEEHQGLILSSFYWGYLPTHIPAGMLSDIFGGKWTLFGGVLLSSICSLLSPIAVRQGGSYALIAARALMGAGQGVVYPALSVLIADWVPRKERSTLGALMMGGGQIGVIFSSSVSGFLLESFKWDITFYFFGLSGLLWLLLFAFICYNQPELHPFIKQSEKDYLAAEMGARKRGKDLPPTPWLAIITNAPVIAMVVAQIGHDYGLFVMVTDLPKYMGDVLQFSIKENGVYSSLPYVLMWVVSIISGLLTDWMIRKDHMSITNARKLMTSIAAFGPAIFIVAASYAGCDRMLVVLLFIIAMGTMGTYFCGMKLSPMDMCPNYAGTVTALSNGIGAITGILAPYIVGLMTPNSSLQEWRLTFWVTFVVLFVTCFVYIGWASGEIQPFNDPEKKD